MYWQQLTTPPLFHSIQAASSTTHNLDHLSSALDRIKESWNSEGSQASNVPVDPGFPVEEDEGDQILPPPASGGQVPIPYTVESGQAVMPAPNIGVPLLRLPLEIEEPPSHSISRPREAPAPSGIKWGIIFGLIFLVGGGTVASYWWKNRRSADLPPHELVVPSADSKGGSKSGVTTPVPQPAPETVKPAKVVPPATVLQPTPDPKALLSSAAPAPLAEDAGLSKSYAQGKAHKATLPKGSWTIRLVIACQKVTVQNAAKLLDAAGTPYYVLPIKMNDGKFCTQIFNGSFRSREEAEAHVKRLPPAFLAGGNKPRPFLVSEIPEKQ